MAVLQIGSPPCRIWYRHPPGAKNEASKVLRAADVVLQREHLDSMTRIYLVDDLMLLREGLHALLETAGHQVVGESSDPTHAVVEAQQQQAQVMLLDLGLGERSGFEVLQELKRRDSPVKALVLTMSAQPRHVAEAVRMGAAGYVLKDSGAAELLLAINTVASGRR